MNGRVSSFWANPASLWTVKAIVLGLAVLLGLGARQPLRIVTELSPRLAVDFRPPPGALVVSLVLIVYGLLTLGAAWVKTTRQRLTIGAPEYDRHSKYCRLEVIKHGWGTRCVLARAEKIRSEGEDHSQRLPLILRWMHHPGEESIPLKHEKLDVASFYNVAVDFHGTYTYLKIKGVHDEEMLFVHEGKPVSLQVTFYDDNHRELASRCLGFERGPGSPPDLKVYFDGPAS